MGRVQKGATKQRGVHKEATLNLLALASCADSAGINLQTEARDILELISDQMERLGLARDRSADG
jgi:hypothetical protein